MSAITLILPVLIPVVFGAGIYLFRFQKREHRQWYVGIIVLLNTLLVYAILLNWPTEGFTLFRFTGNLDISFKLDGMGAVFAGVIATLWPLATLYTFEYMKHEKRENSFYVFYTMTYGVTLGIAFSGNLLTLYLFYELLTLVTVSLVMHTLKKDAIQASRKYLYYSLGGAAFAFIGLTFLNVYGTTLNFQPGGVLDLGKIAGRTDALLFIYVLTFCGFGVKAAIFPFHGWLPNASVAPTPVTALLHAVAVVKSGAFAIMRMTYYSFGTDFIKGTWAQTTVLIIVMATILYGSTMAVKEIHFKKRLAYSTISNLSYILLGVVMMSPLGLIAAMSHLVFHAVMKICSFFCAGAVMYQTDKQYIYELDGIGRKMPVTFTCFTVASLSLIGIPLFPGFISKWNIATAAAASQNIVAYAAIGVLLYSALMTAVYMLTIVVRAFVKTGECKPQGLNEIKDPNWYMKAPLILFCIAIMVMGVYSEPLLRVFEKIAAGKL